MSIQHLRSEKNNDHISPELMARVREKVCRSRSGVWYITNWGQQEDGWHERVIVRSCLSMGVIRHESFVINGVDYALMLGQFDQIEYDFHGPISPRGCDDESRLYGQACLVVCPSVRG